MADDGCSVAGCKLAIKVWARRLCSTHYKRAQREGTLAPLDRFEPLVDRSGDCWLWRGTLNRDGYGRFGGKNAHRVAWERVNGPIPGDLTIDHLCRTRACVRVSHLRLLPPSENYSDNGLRDRDACAHGHAFTEANTKIRSRKGRTHRVCRACDRERHRKAVRP